MAKAASNRELAEGFTEHLSQTEEHVARLETILGAMMRVRAARSAKEWKD